MIHCWYLRTTSSLVSALLVSTMTPIPTVVAIQRVPFDPNCLFLALFFGFERSPEVLKWAGWGCLEVKSTTIIIHDGALQKPISSIFYIMGRVHYPFLRISFMHSSAPSHSAYFSRACLGKESFWLNIRWFDLQTALPSLFKYLRTSIKVKK